MKIKTLAVIVQTEENKVYQVAFTEEMINSLINELPDYFDGGVIKILPEELKGIEITENKFA